MTPTLHVHIDPNQLRELKDVFGNFPHASRIALTRSINRTIGGKKGGIKKHIANEIFAAVKIRKSFIYKQSGKNSERTFFDKKATLTHLSGRVSTQGANIPLINYSNQAGNRKRKAKSIYVTVQRSRGRKKLRHAFVTTLHFGHTGIFARKGKSRYPIKQLHSSRLPDVLSNSATFDRVEYHANRLLFHYLDHELDYLIRKAI